MSPPENPGAYLFELGKVGRRVIEASFDGGDFSSDAGVLLLRHDLALQTAVGRDSALASGPTLCRLEAAASPAHTAALHGVLLDQFIASRAEAPQELILDIDATHVPLHGDQEKAHFHRYYDNYCYLPLYVFCGQDLLACVLRPSSRDPASILSALIKLIAQRLRQQWPEVRIIVRGDSGFCRPAALRRFDQVISFREMM